VKSQRQQPSDVKMAKRRAADRQPGGVVSACGEKAGGYQQKQALSAAISGNGVADLGRIACAARAGAHLSHRRSDRHHTSFRHLRYAYRRCSITVA